MSQSGQPQFPGIVTSDSARPRSAGSIIRLAVVGGVLLGLIGAAGYYVARHTPSDQSQPGAKQSQATPAQAVKNAQAVAQQAQSSKAKATAYQNLGAAYLTNGQSAQAIQSYQVALTNTGADSESRATVLSHLAGAYYEDGNIAQEIVVLQQLVPLLQQSSDPQERALVPRYLGLIQELQGLEQGV